MIFAYMCARAFALWLVFMSVRSLLSQSVQSRRHSIIFYLYIYLLKRQSAITRTFFSCPRWQVAFFDMFPVFVLNVLVQCIFLSNCRAILRLWYALVPRVLVRKSFGHLLSLARTVAISVTELWRRPLRDSRAMIRCNTKRSRIFLKYHFRLFSCDP